MVDLGSKEKNHKSFSFSFADYSEAFLVPLVTKQRKLVS